MLFLFIKYYQQKPQSAVFLLQILKCTYIANFPFFKELHNANLFFKESHEKLKVQRYVLARLDM